MLLHIPEVLDAAQLAALRERMDAANWLDGGLTAGRQSAQAKHNGQLAEDDPLALEAGAMIRQALFRNGLFMSAALPHTVFPPLFNRYAGGQSFGTHVDNAIRDSRVHALRIRTDLSATLFLAGPDEYDGGELLIEDTYGAHRVKLPAGDLVLYPGTSLHRVTPVTRGVRIASFFWIQSLVREDAQRSLLFDLDGSIQALRGEHADSPALVRLTGVYHNLLRRWAHA